MNTAGLAPPNTDALGPHTRHCVGPSARCNCFGTDAPEQRPARRGVHRSRGRGDSLPQLDHRRPCGTPQAQQNREFRLSLASGGTCPLARGRPTVPPVAEGGRRPQGTQGTSPTRVADDLRPRQSRSGWRGRQTWGDHPQPMSCREWSFKSRGARAALSSVGLRVAAPEPTQNGCASQHRRPKPGRQTSGSAAMSAFRPTTW